jgi:hypothetical protein
MRGACVPKPGTPCRMRLPMCLPLQVPSSEKYHFIHFLRYQVLKPALLPAGVQLRSHPSRSSAVVPWEGCRGPSGAHACCIPSRPPSCAGPQTLRLSPQGRSSHRRGVTACRCNSPFVYSQRWPRKGPGRHQVGRRRRFRGRPMAAPMTLENIPPPAITFLWCRHGPSVEHAAGDNRCAASARYATPICRPGERCPIYIPFPPTRPVQLSPASTFTFTSRGSTPPRRAARRCSK